MASFDSLRLGDGDAEDDDGGGTSTASSDIESGESFRTIGGSNGGSTAGGRDETRRSLLGSAVERAERERLARLRDTGTTISKVEGSLDRTARALAETELFGQLTSAQLLQQRESFQRQRAQLAATDEFLARSKGILKRMQHRIVTDKIVQTVIILAEILVIGAIVYVKYIV